MRRTHLLLLRRPIPVTIAALAVATVVSAAGWIQVSMTREVEAQRQANALAKAQNELAAAQNEADRIALEQMQADMRSHIRTFINTGVLNRQVENGSSLFPALVWVDWIADSDLLRGMGPVMFIDDRIAALAKLRDRYRETGQAGTLPDKMAAYSLAFVNLEAGRVEEAAGFIADAEEGVISTLTEKDDLRRALETMRLIVEFERALTAGEPAMIGQLRGALAEHRAQLLAIDGTHPVAHLVDLSFERHPELSGVSPRADG